MSDLNAKEIYIGSSLGRIMMLEWLEQSPPWSMAVGSGITILHFKEIRRAKFYAESTASTEKWFLKRCGPFATRSSTSIRQANSINNNYFRPYCFTRDLFKPYWFSHDRFHQTKPHFSIVVAITDLFYFLVHARQGLFAKQQFIAPFETKRRPLNLRHLF